MKNWLLNQVQHNPTKQAVLADKVSLTYAELYRLALKRARAMRSITEINRPNIIVLLPNSVDFIILIHAVMQLKGTLIPLNPNLTLTEVEKFLDEIEVDLVITKENTAIANMSSSKGKIAVQTIEQLIRIEKQNGGLGKNVEVTEFQGGSRHSIIFTSGTTGRPKGALITYDNLYASAKASQQRLGHSENDRWLLTIPLHHIGGLSIVTRAVIYGITIVLMERFSPENIVRVMNKYAVTLVSLVPVMLKWIVETNAVFPASLRLILLGGATTPSKLVNYCQVNQIPIAVTYGLTESSSQVATCTPPDVYDKPGSAGKALDEIELMIQKENRGLADSPEIGEILIKGPAVISGYVNQKLPINSNGWFYTGDIGYIDEDGDLFVLQRRQDLIISGGENVYPSEVENAILVLDTVSDVCVLGIPSEKWGEKVVSLVEFTIDQKHSVAELIAHCKQRLAGYKIPKDWVFIEKIPRSPTGKIQRDIVYDLFSK